MLIIAKCDSKITITSRHFQIFKMMSSKKKWKYVNIEIRYFSGFNEKCSSLFRFTGLITKRFWDNQKIVIPLMSKPIFLFS